MEGPHGSGGYTPEKTVGWLWGFVWGAGVTLFVTVACWLLFGEPARAEVCSSKIDKSVTKKADHSWRWREIDGKKCWFYAERNLPKTDLVWSYTEEEFNSDVDKVTGRTFYPTVVAPKD